MYIIAGKFHRRKILAPSGSITRPTAARLRETVFNILQDAIINAEFLDIFAGSGAMGIEAISRGAKHTTFIENHRLALHSLKKNIIELHIQDQVTIISQDFLQALKKLQKLGKSFDIIFADAPYHLKRGNVPLSTLLLEMDLLNENGIFLIENDLPELPVVENSKLKWVNSRRSGRAFLHFYRKIL